MAGVELADQLGILNEALQRLEGELAHDASWCALQQDAGLDDSTRARLTETLEANPVYRAWRNMRDAAAMLRPAPDAADAALSPARMTETLAEALQNLPPEEAEAEPTALSEPETVAQMLAAEVAAQTAPQVSPVRASEAPVLLSAEDREAYDVGQRATQAVERILAIPVIEPIAPRTPAPPPTSVSTPARADEAVTVSPPVPPRTPLRDPTDDIGHSVPLDAQDLAFLLTPATRPAAAEERPFLKRLVAEAQSLPTKATVLAPTDPFMVPPAPSAPPPVPPAAETPPDAPPEISEDEARKPRLARLLKAWSRH